MLCLGLVFLVMSLQEFKKGRKAYGWLLLVISLFPLFVIIHGFLLS
ncbi:DUF3953 domain-containing protein [Sporosarcina sp. P29]|nr:DUF3953 domain-containing protein [Sporosarcina sp. P29]